MPIVAQGSLNTAAIIVPDLIVQIVPPQIRTLNGVPSDIIGVVGTASWGPVLAATDHRMVTDYAQSTTEKASWRAYRQSLRDITESYPDPASVVWPTPPDATETT